MKRTKHGLTLKSEAGQWVTEDGVFAIGRVREITTCDEPHPMRFTRADIEAARERPFASWAAPILRAVAEGKRGFVCDGGEHDRECGWDIRSTTGWDSDLFPTLDAAWEWLAQQLAKEQS